MTTILAVSAFLAPSAAVAWSPSPLFNSELVLAALLLVFVLAAIGAFALLQHYMNDPLRKEKREAWYKLFEAHRAERYAKDGMSWRARDLHEHWGPGKSVGW
jgi:hypothetical protein